MSQIKQHQRLAELLSSFSSNLSMNLEVYQLLIFVIDSPCRPHLLTPGSHSVLCVLYLPPVHSSRYYFTIMKFGRGVLWRGEGKHDVFGSCDYNEWGGHPTIKNTQMSFVGNSQIPLHMYGSWLDEGGEGWRCS